MIKPINVSKKLSDGREISIETGKLAKQADGSVVLTMGKTMILASVVSKKEAMDNVDFLPLSVDYQEKFASAGKIGFSAKFFLMVSSCSLGIHLS